MSRSQARPSQPRQPLLSPWIRINLSAGSGIPGCILLCSRSERGPGLRLGFSGPRYFNIHANRGKLTGMPTGTRSRDQRQTPIGEQEDVV